jgi:hypothetical protein
MIFATGEVTTARRCQKRLAFAVAQIETSLRSQNRTTPNFFSKNKTKTSSDNKNNVFIFVPSLFVFSLFVLVKRGQKIGINLTEKVSNLATFFFHSDFDKWLYFAQSRSLTFHQLFVL